MKRINTLSSAWSIFWGLVLMGLMALYLSRDTDIEQYKALKTATTKVFEVDELVALEDVAPHLKELEVLVLKMGDATCVPKQVGLFPNLKALHILGNVVDDYQHPCALPPSLEQLTELETLEIRRLPIPDLGTILNKMFQLKTLIITQTQIEKLPYAVAQFQQLTHLNVSNNHLSELPSHTLAQLPHLVKVEADSNYLVAFPTALALHPKLEYLSLRMNSITAVMNNVPQFDHAPALKTLLLQKNNIQKVQERLSLLTQLQTLHLASNELQSLPNTLKDLAQLEYLDLRHNKFEQVPAVLEAVPQLETLIWFPNPAAEWPDWMNDYTALSDALPANHPRAITPWHTEHLKADQSGYLRLVAHDFQGFQLPEAWKDIQHLELHLTQLRLLPMLDHFPALETLVLVKHPSTTAELYIDPDWEAGSRPNLKKLSIQGFGYTKIPKFWLQLEGIEVFESPNSGLSTLPEKIRFWPNLQQLDLRGNALEVLPESIAQWEGLTYLNFSSNLMRCLPLEIQNLSNLETVVYDQNPISEELDWSKEGGFWCGAWCN